MMVWYGTGILYSISTTNRNRASGELLTIDDAAENSELMCSALTTGHKIRAL